MSSDDREFTGYKDQNGRDVYVGDVYVSEDNLGDDPPKDIGLIVKCDGVFCVSERVVLTCDDRWEFRSFEGELGEDAWPLSSCTVKSEPYVLQHHFVVDVDPEEALTQDFAVNLWGPSGEFSARQDLECGRWSSGKAPERSAEEWAREMKQWREETWVCFRIRRYSDANRWVEWKQTPAGHHKVLVCGKVAYIGRDFGQALRGWGQAVGGDMVGLQDDDEEWQWRDLESAWAEARWTCFLRADIERNRTKMYLYWEKSLAGEYRVLAGAKNVVYQGYEFGLALDAWLKSGGHPLRKEAKVDDG